VISPHVVSAEQKLNVGLNNEAVTLIPVAVWVNKAKAVLHMYAT
jgi:hypothetical protein